MDPSRNQTASNVDPWNANLNTPLEVDDPEVFGIIELEKYRQFSCLELIASENFTSEAVMQANGSPLTNKYSEGYPAARYYGGNEYIDMMENLCRRRALEAFHLDPKEWGVNVQPYSGSQANFSAYTALLSPHDRIMGLDLPSGGHLTHGYQTAKKKITASALYFESMPYQVDMTTGFVDYDKLEANAKLFRPKLIICGASAYAREWDYARLRSIADEHDAYLMADMAHVSGLVAAREQNDPFAYAHVVTTTTHKTLRGPRAGLIFFNLLHKNGELESKINQAVFPGNQGGPHNNTIAAIAVALRQVASPLFRDYASQIRKNALALADALKKLGHKIVTNGTDNHIVLWDLRPHGLTGNKFENLCDRCSITLNKNTIHGDKSALVPGGVRLGTPALTSRSFRESDFEKIAGFLNQAFVIAMTAQAKAGSKLLKDYVGVLDSDSSIGLQIKELRNCVEAFAKSFPMPGFDSTKIKLPVDQNGNHH